MMEKIHLAKRLFDRSLRRLQCPVCHKPMKVIAGGSLICKTGHSFDFAKQGYVNLAGSRNSLLYDKVLFQARRAIFQAGFYQPLADALIQSIIRYEQASQRQSNPQKKLILDAGCGEGYYLRTLAANGALGERYTFCGVDLAKEGIAAAAGRSEMIMWSIADLTNLPFRSQTVQILLNILSPASYAEFFRVLAKDGMLIKVIPEAGYLKEIRERACGRLENQAYSNQEVLQLAHKHMKILEQNRITYEKPVTPSDFAHFVRMTPLTAGLAGDEKEAIIAEPCKAMTMDLTIIAGQKK